MIRSPRALLSLPFALAAGLVVPACAPPGECAGYSDCPATQFCREGVCVGDSVVDAGGGGRRDAGPVVGNNDAGPVPDGGPDVANVQIRTTFNVPWIQWHASDPNRILFAELQESGNVVASDLVRAIDIEQRRVVVGVVYDLTTMIEGPCKVDSIIFAPAPDETWFNCDLPPGLRIAYDGNVAQPTNNETDSAHVVHRIPGNGTDFARVLAAERGGALRSLQIRNTDGLNQQRFPDSFQTAVGGVVAIFDLLAGTIPGRHVLVHDAVSDLLVPLSRDLGAEVWLPTAALDPYPLPAETHVAWVTDDIAANGNAAAPNEPNFMTIEPSTGLARYWSYEQAQEILPATRFETDVTYQGAVPAATERLLLALSPSADFLFYARADGRKIYRIPLVPGGDALVRQALIDDSNRIISSVLADSDDTVWVSYQNENLVERLTLDVAQ